MNPLLAEPIAAKATNAAMASPMNPLQLASVGMAGINGNLGANSAGNAAAFQNSMLATQTRGDVSLQDFVGLQGTALQKQLAALNPTQRLQLAQQMIGSRVQIQTSSGQIISGHAGKLQIMNGQPVFQVSGQNFSLDNLVSITPRTGSTSVI